MGLDPFIQLPEISLHQTTTRLPVNFYVLLVPIRYIGVSG